MPVFVYRAYSESGDLKTGELDAPSAEAAERLLDGQGLIPLAVSQRGKGSGENWWDIELTSGGGISQQDLARFTRECATLVEAELPIDQVLRVVAGQAPGAKLRKVCDAVLSSVMNGASLSDALKEYPKIFPAFYTGIVQAGEAAGHLKHVFTELADYLERRVRTAARIKSALVYPAVLGLVAMVAIGVIIAVLVPNLVPLFEDTGAELPASLALIVGIRDAVVEYWPLVLIGLGLLAVGAIAVVRSEGFRTWAHRWSLRAPLIGPLTQKRESARLGRMLGTLLRAGVTLLPAIQHVRTATGNSAVAGMLEGAAEELRQGGSLHAAIRNAKLLPDLVPQLISVGEETGRLDHMLLHMAGIFEQQAETQVERMMTLLTPLLTLLIGLGVGSLIITVMNAILSVNELAL
ncbi:MAG: type II secretion system F family protein [Pseudomonadota bacterium]